MRVVPSGQIIRLGANLGRVEGNEIPRTVSQMPAVVVADSLVYFLNANTTPM